MSSIVDRFYTPSFLQQLKQDLGRFESGQFRQEVPSIRGIPAQTLDWHFLSSTALSNGTLFWVHGLGGSHLTELNFAKDMAQRNRRVVVIDLPGSGDSGWFVKDGRPLRATDHVDPQEAREVVIDGLTQLVRQQVRKHREPFFVGGNSMGGALALIMAPRFQGCEEEKYFRGVLNCAAFVSDGQAHPVHPYIPFLESLKNPHDLFALPVALLTEVMGALGVIWWFSSGQFKGSDIVNLAQLSMRVHWPRDGRDREWLSQRALAQATYARLTRMGMTDLDLLAEQKTNQEAIRVPVLCVYGGHDPIVRPSQTLAAQIRTMPDSRAVIVSKKSGWRDGLGHFVLQEYPGPLAALFSGVMTHLIENPGSHDLPINASAFRRCGATVTVHSGRT